LEKLQTYIANPSLLNRQEAEELETWREKFPYFQALHILIAKCHQNQNTYGFNKNLKLASLYAGNREILYKFINSEIENKSIENLDLGDQEIITKPLLEENKIIEQFDNIETKIDYFVKVEELDIINSQDAATEAKPLINKEIEPSKIEETTIIEESNNTLIEKIVCEEEIEEEKIHDDLLLKINEVPDEVEQNIPAYILVPELILATDISQSIELDFNTWLDNFSTDVTQSTVKPSIDNATNKEDILVFDFEEPQQNQVAIYNPAAWAEIAYDIQAFVKTKDTENAILNEDKKPSKTEIDDLLERFIKKSPSISRTKVEFYKPENMAKKSEEFHAEVASETLAKLFFKQGHLHASLEMYEKLLLQNPDKKDIFAPRIKSIKEELINRL